MQKEPTDKPSSDEKHIDNCLAAALFDENGNLLERKLVLPKPGKKQYYALNINNNRSNNNLIIPIAGDRVNMVENYTQYYGFVDLQIK